MKIIKNNKNVKFNFKGWFQKGELLLILWIISAFAKMISHCYFCYSVKVLECTN